MVCNNCTSQKRECLTQPGSASCDRCLESDVLCVSSTEMGNASSTPELPSLIRKRSPPRHPHTIASNQVKSSNFSKPSGYHRCETCRTQHRKCTIEAGEVDCTLCLKIGTDCIINARYGKSTRHKATVQSSGSAKSTSFAQRQNVQRVPTQPPNMSSQADKTKEQERIKAAFAAAESACGNSAPTSSAPESSSTAASTPQASQLPPNFKRKAGRPANNPEPRPKETYPGQPTILCCALAKATSPVKDDYQRALQALAKRVAGRFPFDVTTVPIKKYGVIWTDYTFLIGVAFREQVNKTTRNTGVTWYGYDSATVGDIVELMVQNPDVVTRLEGEVNNKECFVRSASVDFGCTAHKKKTWTMYAVRWQAEGEAARRVQVRQAADDAGKDFQTAMDKDREDHMRM